MMRARSLSMDSVVVASPKQVSCDVASETVLLSLESGAYFGLNEVGATIWRLIQERRTIAQICDALLAEYEGITPEQCRAETMAFLAEMQEMCLVEVT
jgi:coenzyme PQQ synthesis protein D (PqqD)